MRYVDVVSVPLFVLRLFVLYRSNRILLHPLFFDVMLDEKCRMSVSFKHLASKKCDKVLSNNKRCVFLPVVGLTLTIRIFMSFNTNKHYNVLIIVPVKEGENIEKALKKFKRKAEKTGVIKEVRARKQYDKPSVLKRIKMQHAIYVNKLRTVEE